MTRTDILIVGGGPAGLATAIAASRRGFRVTVADGRRPPIDKACGEGLMPDALAAAGRLGVSIPAEESFLFRGVRFLGADGEAATASFPRGFGMGVRRTALHALLVEQAERAGVDLRWGDPVTGMDTGIVWTRTETFRAQWVIGADGGQSRARTWAGLAGCSRDVRRFGFRRHYRITPWTNHVEVYWGRSFQIYVTAVAPEEVCVALISRNAQLRLDDVLGRFPELKAKLAGAEQMTNERGAITATRRLCAVFRGRVALVGDASGSVDAITGEGVGVALQQALALVDAIERERLDEYAQAHRRIARRPTFMADFMLLMDRWPVLQNRALEVFARRPDIFARLVAMHVGQLPVFDFAAASFGLAWRMLL
ncbi:MAG TPA: NAD(P)/FAD-dependent oxidoreductase [Bryobacteraceae bacterium]|nr:NAD(P)/FAD-dependent oxidoreductase [Bryobacteraceae bacterium]